MSSGPIPLGTLVPDLWGSQELPATQSPQLSSGYFLGVVGGEWQEWSSWGRQRPCLTGQKLHIL